MKNTKRVLVCPLDWGLGHATRCIPVIRELRRSGAEVMIASSGRSAALLKMEFPGLTHIEFPGYNISYPENIGMVLWTLALFPKILLRIIREHDQLKKIISENNIDIVISDNRFGLWNNKVRTVFMTHQIRVKCPPAFGFCEPLLESMNRWFIDKYDHCWIPDLPGNENLSGELSHVRSLPRNTSFIGVLSRFEQAKNPVAKKRKLLAILSGPEPQRTVFEKKLIGQLRKLNYKTYIVRGVTEENSEEILSENITIVSHLGTEKMKEAILESELIISRSGYSTVMDLAVLGAKAVFIPTPGQTEQEYLCEYFKNKKMIYSETQNEFDLERCIKESGKYSGLTINSISHHLSFEAEKLLSE